MIDLHCHLLPGLDDGPETLDEAVAMARIAVADGITTVVATPHMFDGAFEVAPERRDTALAELTARLAAEAIPLRVLAGGECRIHEHLLTRLQTAAPRYTLNGTGRCCLLEWPEGVVPPHFEQFLFAAQIAGLQVLLAHPERHADIQRKPELLERLVERGLLLQISAGSLTGAYGRGARRAAERLLAAGSVRVLATDAHDPDSRPPLLTAAVERAVELLGPVARNLVTTFPAALLAAG